MVTDTVQSDGSLMLRCASVVSGGNCSGYVLPLYSLLGSKHRMLFFAFPFLLIKVKILFRFLSIREHRYKSFIKTKWCNGNFQKAGDTGGLANWVNHLTCSSSPATTNVANDNNSSHHGVTLKNGAHEESNLILVDGMTWRHKFGGGAQFTFSP